MVIITTRRGVLTHPSLYMDQAEPDMKRESASPQAPEGSGAASDILINGDEVKDLHEQAGEDSYTDDHGKQVHNLTTADSPTRNSALSAPNSAEITLTPRGEPLSRRPTHRAGVQLAQYANVDVLELAVGEQKVMRRVNDGSVNATQLLKVAGLDHSKRQRVLDHDITDWSEKIQGGTHKYQGTWVHLGTAKSLAHQYHVYDELKPLLELDLSEVDAMPRETPENAEHQRYLAVAAAAAAAAAGHGNETNGDFEKNSLGAKDPVPKEEASSQNDSEGATQEDGVLSSRQPTIDDRMRVDEQSAATEAATAAAAAAAPLTLDPAPQLDDSMMEGDDLMTLPPLEPEEGDVMAETSRDIVTELFLSANRGQLQHLDDILHNRGISQIQPDIPIDDAGHTALHWAAVLGKVALVSDLVEHGADCRRGNRRGESPLVRAVLVTNSSDTQTFGQLLDLLYPCLHLGDAQGRTVLHHIALTAGIPGRSDASRYYLDALLEWAVRCHGASGVQWLVDELVNAQDANGDTALNIAARLGSRQIAQQLVDVGAAVDLPNRAGLRPVDFGVTGGLITDAGFGLNGNANGTAIAGATPLSIQSRSDGVGSHDRSRDITTGSGAGSVARFEELHEKIGSQLGELDALYQSDMSRKDTTLRELHHHLREASDMLEQLESRKRSLEQRNSSLKSAKKRAVALDAACIAENRQFNADTEQLPDMPMPSLDTAFDADEPFRVETKEDARKLPPVLLKARIAAYRQNEKQLDLLRKDLMRSSLDGEAKYRQVVAQCTSSDVEKVDEILEDLLAAVSKGDDKKITA